MLRVTRINLCRTLAKFNDTGQLYMVPLSGRVCSQCGFETESLQLDMPSLVLARRPSNPCPSSLGESLRRQLETRYKAIYGDGIA